MLKIKQSLNSTFSESALFVLRASCFITIKSQILYLMYEGVIMMPPPPKKTRWDSMNPKL